MNNTMFISAIWQENDHTYNGYEVDYEKLFSQQQKYHDVKECIVRITSIGSIYKDTESGRAILFVDPQFVPLCFKGERFRLMSTDKYEDVVSIVLINGQLSRE